MIIAVIVLLPLVLVLVAYVGLVRMRAERTALEAPSLDAAGRMARWLGGRVISSDRTLRVEAQVEGRAIACTVSKSSRFLSFEVASSARLPAALVSTSGLGGRDLADYADQTVILLTPEGAESVMDAGAAAEAMKLLPDSSYDALAEIGTPWLTLSPGSIVLSGAAAPESDDAHPHFERQVRRIVELVREIEARR